MGMISSISFKVSVGFVKIKILLKFKIDPESRVWFPKLVKGVPPSSGINILIQHNDLPVSSTTKEQNVKLSTNLCSEGTQPTSDPCIHKTLWTAEQGIVGKERRENQKAQILIYDIRKSCNLILCSIHTLFLFVCLSLQSKEKFSKFYTPVRGSSSYLSILSFTMRAPF